MSRESFLEQFWQSYPAAETGWQTVADFSLGDSESPALVCGRLGRARPAEGPSAQGWWLEADGVRIPIRFAPDCRWLGLRAGAEFETELLKPGDLIGVECRNRTADGRILEALACRLLVPTRGEFALADPGFTTGRAESWQTFTASVREFFRERKFTEMTTPTLVPSPGTEPFLVPFRTTWAMGSRFRDMYLPTSPEFHLKKLLAAGWTRIYELKTCFRNAEVGPHHQPEFTMLEWYRAFAHLDAVADDVESLLAHTARAAGKSNPGLERTTMRELFAKHFNGFRLRPDTTRDELIALAHEVGVEIRDQASATPSPDTWDELFFRIFLDKIEPHLGVKSPLLVHGYPPSQAALARLGKDGFADRFEVYWRGLEIANAFHELNDPRENARRFADDLAVKRANGLTPVPLDLELMRALEHGLPPSGGIALGLDRLFMAIYEISNLTGTRAFPFVIGAEKEMADSK